MNRKSNKRVQPPKTKTSRPRKSRSRSRPMKLPRTGKVSTRGQSHGQARSRATNSMTMTDLQFMAQSLGIPWGGIDSKSKLVKKINNYY